MKNRPANHHSLPAIKRLDELKPLKKQLQERTKKIEEYKKKQALQKRQIKTDQQLFQEQMQNVTPLQHEIRAQLEKVPIEPLPFKRIADDIQVMHDSLSDEFDVESLLETDDTLSYRVPGIGPDVVKKLRRGYWTIEAEMDLHGYRRDEARNKLNEFIQHAYKNAIRCVRIIHGKGLGSPGRVPVLKSYVLSWLVQKNEVLAYVQARAADGGSGALVVLLKAHSTRKKA